MGKLRSGLSSFGSLGNTEPIIISGWLWKLKRNPQAMSISDWNKRFFTIEGDYMYWHKTKGSERSGKVKISDIKSVKIVSNSRPITLPPKEDKNPTFLVKARERTLFLRSDRAKDVDRWVRMIQMQCDLRNGGTSQGPKCEKNQKKSNGGGDKFELLSRELDKLLENVEQVELEVNSPTTGMRKGRMGGGRRGGTKADITIDDEFEYEDEDNRKIPATKFSLQIKDDNDVRRKKEVDSWGGRVDFENDKSILEPVSPSYNPGSPNHSPPERLELTSRFGGVAHGAKGGGNAQGIKVRRKKVVSSSKENSQQPCVQEKSPPKITYTTPKKDQPTPGRSQSDDDEEEGKDELGDSGGGMFESSDLTNRLHQRQPRTSHQRHGESPTVGDRSGPSLGLASPQEPLGTPPSRNVTRKLPGRGEVLSSVDFFGSPVSVETTVLTNGTPGTRGRGRSEGGRSTGSGGSGGSKRRRKKKNSKKNNNGKTDDEGEGSIDFESSLESLEEIAFSTGTPKEGGRIELEEFLELEELEEMASHQSSNLLSDGYY
ncbi:hypothetical protein TrCOL_g2968 [Triparma columacea]|uniref:PH domain-containing protein n=1 Tax=Triparma columacea TaxID=722753 RepID=A0A9W7G5J3_9STRA|nr:hypothetical protein TrCOL_g2968 [Triparma columacea]